MQWSDLSFAPSPRTLRRFAGLWMLFFAALACWEGLRHGNHRLAAALAGLAATVGPLGLAKPRTIRPIFVGWMLFAFPIGWTVSRTLLAGLFYALFTPLGFLFRIIGRDVLCRRNRQGRATYWTAKPQATDARSYFRQF